MIWKMCVITLWYVVPLTQPPPPPPPQLIFISKQHQSKSSSGEAILMAIERQAYIQVLLIRLSNTLDPDESRMIGEVWYSIAVFVYPFFHTYIVLQFISLEEQLNKVLDDTSTGGGSSGCHGLTLAMNIMRKQESFRALTCILTDMYDDLCAGINCLKPFHIMLSVSSLGSS